jgi:hypothetical protein
MRHDSPIQGRPQPSIPPLRARLEAALESAAGEQVDESQVFRAVTDYCQGRRSEGANPEQVLVELKRAMHRRMRERRPALVDQLVNQCIRDYYQDD